jgi:hypothetical protein
MTDTDWYLRYGCRPSPAQSRSRPAHTVIAPVGSAPHAGRAQGQAPPGGPPPPSGVKAVDERPQTHTWKVLALLNVR